MEKKEFDVMKAIFGDSAPRLNGAVSVPVISKDPIFATLQHDILETMSRFERKFGHVVPFVFIACAPMQSDGKSELTALAECQVKDWPSMSGAFVALQDHHISETLRSNGLIK